MEVRDAPEPYDEAGGHGRSPRFARMLRPNTFAQSVRSLTTLQCAPNTGISCRASTLAPRAVSFIPLFYGTLILEV